jgi:hypothetical protein
MSPTTPVLSLNTACASPSGPSPTFTRAASDLLPRVVAARDLDKQPFTPPPWLWHGYLGPGKVTLLTSQWKSGKTTLVSLLLARLQQGGQLAGLPVAAAKAFVISEESQADWAPRFQHLGIRDNVDLLCRPFAAQPTMDQWLALIDTAAALHDRQGTALVVIDSLAQFLPAHSENSASALLECLTPLQRLTSAGMSVLLPHHPRKGKTVADQAARGSGALPGFVDILIEMAYYSHPDDLDRRRRLLAFSRHDQTPRHLLIELDQGGTDYVVLQSGVEAGFGESWQALIDVLTAACTKMTRQEILNNWSADYDKPDGTTLWRWLTRAVAQGVLRQEGTGRSSDPFRYWLPARQEMMRPDGGTVEEMLAWNDRYMAEMFERLEVNKVAPPPGNAVPSSDEEAAAAAPVAAPEATSSPLETLPPLERAAPASLAPDPPLPEQAAAVAPQAPEAPVRLPYPFSIMDPASVPEDAWQRARAAQRFEKGDGPHLPERP